ncbi:sensor histidine kinase [Pontibacter ramchanderi]|uniref:histidine kinase n=1 Tax=Pontibacter ramchanderi TaxID=1179743 RepID=A0A2N3V0K8_9BACT|nr:PAS domain-containing sensor histidine kinase [Pontibacter ramchanderi]PKV75142.1 two-component system CheB/CheR fusion protein [Pontibacter ramchanderi]
MKSHDYKERIISTFIEQVKEYAIFAMDTNGIIETWNEGAERLKGYTESEVVGKYYGMLFTEEDQRNGAPDQELEAAKTQEYFVGEGWRRKKDGAHFWANVTLTPIYNDRNELIGLTKVTRDLSDRRQAEESLRKKHDELEATNRDLDNFIYTASHDLKAPILNIDGLLQRLDTYLEQKGMADEELSELIQHIQTSVNRFKSTIEDLTTISRLQRSIETERNAEHVLVEPVFEDIMADVNFLFAAFEFPCEVQHNFEVKSLRFSRKNFRSILYNLVSNAIKYRSQDCDCRIMVSTHREGDWVVLSVKDNGLGISPENQKNLFTMFKRFHDHVDGSGIGLYIIKRIIDNAQGKIEVKTKAGEGSEFKVYLKA